MTIKNILLATDFSDTACVAKRYAVAFAEKFGASLHVLHVLEDPLPGWKPPHHVASVPVIRENMELDARNQLDLLLTDAEREALHATSSTTWGKPFVEIIRYAKEHKIDMIVIGTHGHGPVMHMLMGSAAEKVVRKAQCAVLTVRLAEHDFVLP